MVPAIGPSGTNLSEIQIQIQKSPPPPPPPKKKKMNLKTLSKRTGELIISLRPQSGDTYLPSRPSDGFGIVHFNGLVQDFSNSSAIAMALLQSCTKPLIWATLDQVMVYYWMAPSQYLIQNWIITKIRTLNKNLTMYFQWETLSIIKCIWKYFF